MIAWPLPFEVAGLGLVRNHNFPMNRFRFSSRSAFGVLASLALSWLPATDSHAQGPIPAGDLTVTVEEQENGEVKFSLSGTAYMQGSGSFDTTNFTYPPTAPVTGYGSFGLPPGLQLTVPDRMELICGPCTSESPEEGPLPEVDLLINSVQFNSFGWYLGFFKSGLLQPWDRITGSGSVTTNTVPFHLFVPGTYVITPALDSEPEGAEVAEGEETIMFRSPYSITYTVIPFAANPDLTISSPPRFPRTRVRRSAPSQVVTIRNRGNVTVRNLSLALTGRDKNDFSHGPLPVKELAPGQSTRVTVGFKPLGKELRTADLEVSGLYQPPMPATIAAEPEQRELALPDPVAVSASAKLEGVGFVPKRKRNPIFITPRFPRGIY
jgi:hypothetical protein